MAGKSSLNLMLWKQVALCHEKGCFRKDRCAEGFLEHGLMNQGSSPNQVLVALRRIGEKKLRDGGY